MQEEKQDRIVELVVSSIRARDLLLGKVIGIGAAGVLQMLIWAVSAAVLLTYGGTILGLVGADPSLVTAIQTARALPDVPLAAGIIFILCFAGGFFLFATLYAIVGSAITNTREAQSLVMPIIVPFMFGLFIAMSAGENPNSGLAIAGSFIPAHLAGHPPGAGALGRGRMAGGGSVACDPLRHRLLHHLGGGQDLPDRDLRHRQEAELGGADPLGTGGLKRYMSPCH